MADDILIDQTNPLGRELIEAAQQIQKGIATFQRHQEPLGNLIAAGGAAKIESVYGVDVGDGQTMFDRLSPFLNFLSTPYVDPATDPDGYEVYAYSAKIRDLAYGIFPKIGQ